MYYLGRRWKVLSRHDLALGRSDALYPSIDPTWTTYKLRSMWKQRAAAEHRDAHGFGRYELWLAFLLNFGAVRAIVAQHDL